MRKIILFAITLFICSCSGNSDTEKIGIDNIIKKVPIVSSPDLMITKVSEIASEISYIPLQHSVNTPIYAIEKIVVRDNKIYINSVSNIFCFDYQGNLLYKLYGNENEKKENIVAVYDFDIDKGDTTLIILYGNKILHFKNTGSRFDYIKTLKLGRLSTAKMDFVPGTGKILISSNRVKENEPSIKLLINTDGDILSLQPSYFRRFDPIKNRIWDRVIHYQYENKLHYRERFNDTIFSVSAASDSFTPYLILDSRISSTTSENINDPEYFRILPNVVNIFEVPRYFYYAYYFGQVNYKVFYDKYEDRKYEVDPSSGILIDDLVGGPDFDPKYCNEGKIYGWISAKELKQYIESEDFAKAQVQDSQKKGGLKSLAGSLKETDNPVLIVVKPKD